MRTRRSQSSSDPMRYLSPFRRESHQSVLCHEAIELLQVRDDDVIVDATVGSGGHASAIAKRLGRGGVLIGFDVDTTALKRARRALTSLLEHKSQTPEVHLIRANFRDISNEIGKLGIFRITKALFDLGWSIEQLSTGRGFSFLRDEPLMMTYETRPAPSALTARTIVNEWSEKSIADVIFGFGGERYARKIARAIVRERAVRPIRTSGELAELVCRAIGRRSGRIHPATRTFQALRIAVNDEIGSLKEGLAQAWNFLAPGGRIAVISFHSLEDRIVKHFFIQCEKSGEGRRITKKPIVSTRDEAASNPHARSAKLRVIEKISHATAHTKTKSKQAPPLDFSG